MNLPSKICGPGLLGSKYADDDESCKYTEDTDKTTLLIAEDNLGNYKFFECVLCKDYTLFHAWNGREAVELYEKYRPELILMDIKMPEMDGYEAAAAIRKISPLVPIVAVTALAFPEDLECIRASGFDDCLVKPVKVDKLRKTLLKFCRSEK